MFVAPLPVRAQADTQFGLESEFAEVGVQTDRDVRQLTALVINIVLGFLGIVAVTIIIYAGYLWMTAGGNEENVARAKLMLRNAAIGLVIVLSAWGIAAFIISRLSGATGNPLGPPSGGTGGDGSFPPVTSGDQFIVREFQTARRGEDPRRNVARCSDVQAQFSHILAGDTLSDAAIRGNLKVLQTKTGVNAEGAGGTPQNPPAVVGVGAGGAGNALEFELDHQKTNPSVADLWDAWSEYELRIPKTVKDFAGNVLSGCPDCDNAESQDDYFAWRFTTDDQLDETRPQLARAYPQFPGTAEYPDRDVDRKTTFVLEFSEPIKISNATITLEERAGETDAAVRRTIGKDLLDIQFIGSRVLRFQVSDRYLAAFDKAPGFLEPSAWYRLFIDGITDLCGNGLNPAFNQWLFKTNSATPGIAFSYPANASGLSCPNVETFIQFRTSMYDIRTNSCEVDSRNGFGGLVKSGDGVPGRLLGVADGLPADPAAPPSRYCKRYAFESAQDLLAPNTPYTPRAAYFNQAEGALKTHQWSFATSPIDQCVNSPYITTLSPKEGPWGRCLTVVGGNFGDAALTGSAVYATLAPPDSSSLNKSAFSPSQSEYWNAGWRTNQSQFALGNDGWGANSIATTLDNFDARTGLGSQMPNTSQNQELDVAVTVATPNPFSSAGGGATLESNTALYRVDRSRAPYIGPCLASLSPSSGNRGEKVTVRGKRFLKGFDRNAGGHEIRLAFLNDTLAPLDTWAASGPTADSQIIIKIPDAGRDGLVSVETVHGRSNGLWYDVRLPNEGGSKPVATFSISSSSPRTGAATAFQTTTPLHPGSANPAAYDASGARTGGTVALHQCVRDADTVSRVCRGESAPGFRSAIAALPRTGEQCGNSTDLIRRCSVIESAPEPISLVAPASDDPLAETRRDLWPGSALSANSEYRAIVYGGLGGIRSTSGMTMLNPNYDSDFDERRIRDAFSWRFETDENGIPGPPKDEDDADEEISPDPAANLAVRSYTPGASALACRNMVVEAVLDGTVDRATATADAFSVRRAGGGAIAGSVLVEHVGARQTRLSFTPGVMFDAEASYEIVLAATERGLRSTAGGVLVAGGPCSDVSSGQCVIRFTTVNDAEQEAECSVSRLAVEPAFQAYSCAGRNTCPGDASPMPGHQRYYRGRTTARNSQPVTAPAGAAWEWQSSEPSVVAQTVPSETLPVVAFTVLPKNGTTRISASIVGTAFSSSAEARVFLCENPWPASLREDGFPYQDENFLIIIICKFYFSFFYCRDRGEPGARDDAPSLNAPIINETRTSASGATLVRELFFIQPSGSAPGASDAIGVRVLANPEHRGVSEWYGAQSFPKGDPTTTSVDGYQALEDGRTMYVAAPNDTDGPAGAGRVFPNIYLVSYNDGAHPATAAIADELVANWRFNVNVPDAGDRDKLRLDFARLADGRRIADILASRPAPLLLPSGTFIADQSNSAWPSWNDTLGPLLGTTLPVDPVNTLACGAGHPSPYCFVEGSPTRAPSFSCTASSRAYFYRADAASARLSLTLEYPNPAQWSLGNGWGVVSGSCANIEFRADY